MAKTEQEIKIRNDEVEWEPRPTLGSADYASAEVWEQEREKIWWGEWVCVGRTEEVPNPGDYIVRDIAGESVFIVRNDAGELHAFYNVCSHRGTKFLDDIDGTQNVRKAFVCPYHAWTFDLNGQLIGSPNVQEDEHFDRADHPLYGIAVDHYAGFLFVNLHHRWSEGDAARVPDRRRGVDHRVRPVQDGRAPRGRAPRLRGEGQLEDRGRELQRVPALPAGPPRARPGDPAVPVRRGLGRGDPRRRQPDGGGRDVVHADRRESRCRSSRTSSPRTTRCTTAATSSRT